MGDDIEMRGNAPLRCVPWEPISETMRAVNGGRPRHFWSCLNCAINNTCDVCGIEFGFCKPRQWDLVTKIGKGSNIEYKLHCSVSIHHRHQHSHQLGTEKAFKEVKTRLILHLMAKRTRSTALQSLLYLTTDGLWLATKPQIHRPMVRQRRAWHATQLI